jgi:hypothetical protein
MALHQISFTDVDTYISQINNILYSDLDHSHKDDPDDSNCVSNFDALIMKVISLLESFTTKFDPSRIEKIYNYIRESNFKFSDELIAQLYKILYPLTLLDVKKCFMYNKINPIKEHINSLSLREYEYIIFYHYDNIKELENVVLVTNFGSFYENHSYSNKGETSRKNLFVQKTYELPENKIKILVDIFNDLFENKNNYTVHSPKGYMGYHDIIHGYFVYITTISCTAKKMIDLFEFNQLNF